MTEHTDQLTRALPRAERAVILTIAILGSIGGAITAIATLGTGIMRLIDPSRVALTLNASLPVAHGDGVIAAEAQEIIAHPAALAALPLGLFVASDIVTACTIALVTACVCLVLVHIAKGRPFHRSMQIAAGIAGGALTIGSMLAQGLSGIGTLIAADQLRDTLNNVIESSFSINLLIPLLGIATLGLVYVFRSGETMEHETEGLV